MKKNTFYILLAIFAINLSLSIYLELRDWNTNPALCNISPTTNCLEVKNSPYSYTLGIKNTIIGIISNIIFIILTITYYKKPHNNLRITKTALLLVASIFAIRFIYIQYFVIQRICPYCLIIDTLTILGLIVFYNGTKNNLI